MGYACSKVRDCPTREKIDTAMWNRGYIFRLRHQDTRSGAHKVKDRPLRSIEERLRDRRKVDARQPHIRKLYLVRSVFSACSEVSSSHFTQQVFSSQKVLCCAAFAVVYFVPLQRLELPIGDGERYNLYPILPTESEPAPIPSAAPEGY